jgi:hypothetical protein
MRDRQGNLGKIAGRRVDHIGPTGRRFWSGTFSVPTGSPLPAGDYRLVLDDGRAGDIVVTWSSVGLRANAIANFNLEGCFQ